MIEVDGPKQAICFLDRPYQLVAIRGPLTLHKNTVLANLLNLRPYADVVVWRLRPLVIKEDGSWKGRMRFATYTASEWALINIFGR